MLLLKLSSLAMLGVAAGKIPDALTADNAFKSSSELGRIMCHDNWLSVTTETASNTLQRFCVERRQLPIASGSSYSEAYDVEFNGIGERLRLELANRCVPLDFPMAVSACVDGFNRIVAACSAKTGGVVTFGGQGKHNCFDFSLRIEGGA